MKNFILFYFKLTIFRPLYMWWGYEWGGGKCVCVCCRIPRGWGRSISVLISWAILTKHHTPGRANSSWCPRGCRGWKPETVVSEGLAPPEAFLIGLWMAIFCLHPQVVLCLCLPGSLSSPLTRTSVRSDQGPA